jgi:hypothetical protein
MPVKTIHAMKGTLVLSWPNADDGWCQISCDGETATLARSQVFELIGLLLEAVKGDDT